ncbi:divalent-cation tolerance protein CutA [Pyruvatibacter mobilis]|uniref:divalent-cation tolerance protein CutA n=1 Tax=Pyruvatibacter mobilis TaxID=1712261 RepID=UPI003C7DF631
MTDDVAEESIVFIYTTAPSVEVARQLAKAVVEARLAACANMLPGMEVIYEWDGALQQEAEVAVLFKTRAACVAAAMDMIAANHPYDTPAITAFTATDAAPDFAAWIMAQTTRQSSS